MTQATGRDALLTAFDRLLDKASKKLNMHCSFEDRIKAKQTFIDRFHHVLKVADVVDLPIAERTIEKMERSIDAVSPTEVATYLASGPVAHHMQEVMRSIALKAAEEKVLEHYLSQADDEFGGN